MQFFTLSIIAVLVVAAVFCLVNFRFLLYPVFPGLNPLKIAKRLSLTGSSIFISDLHLKADRPFRYSEAIRRVLEDRRVANLIVVGDLFDSPKDGRLIAERAAESRLSDLLGIRNLRINAFFVQGSPPHDPPLKENDDFNIAPFVPVGKCAVLRFNDATIIVYHGHDLSLKGMVGHGWDRFISRLSLERAWKRFACVPDGDWVIFGHTHIPGIDTKHRVANCGGWQTIPLLVRPARTGLYLSPENNSLEVVHFA